MISVARAIEIVINNSSSMVDSKTVQLTDSLGYTLSENVISPIYMPPFRQSAMDGYALKIANSNSYRLIGEIKAGDNNNPKLNAGEAVRIFTGAPVPDTANAVVMQEKTSKQNNTLVLKSSLKLNENIRPLGEQVRQGQIALNKGTKITAAGIAYLASLGITEVKVSTKPTIAIMVTGNELAEPGCNLKYGQIYESNAIMLKVALKKHGYDDVSIHKVDDDYQKTENLLNETISNHDVVLVSGGISVGDYDFVGKALASLGVEQLFYKVKQKPGKPLFFGKKDEKIIFALPGNPAAALSCFYVYVLKALERISGNTNFDLPTTKAFSISNFEKKGDRAQFLKAVYNHGKVKILEGQSSAMLHTFALANALVYLNEDSESVKIDDEIDVLLLPIN